MTSKDAENNLNAFLAQFGTEGFIELFFTNYLFELVMHFLHSKGKGDSDTSRLYYAYKGKVFSREEIKKFENELRQECSARAKRIVNSLKERDIQTKLTDKIIEDPKIVRVLQQNLESILSEVSEV